jgi:hypothetical protein
MGVWVRWGERGLGVGPVKITLLYWTGVLLISSWLVFSYRPRHVNHALATTLPATYGGYVYWSRYIVIKCGCPLVGVRWDRQHM